VLSVLVFTLSLLLSGFQLSETASKYRSCYLELQRLIDNPPEDLADRYHDILEKYPNHSDIDDKRVLYSAQRAGRPITSVNNDQVTEIKATCRDIFRISSRKYLFLGIYPLCFLLPVILFVCLGCHFFR
jgi:hypothetical protein